MGQEIGSPLAAEKQRADTRLTFPIGTLAYFPKDAQMGHRINATMQCLMNGYSPRYAGHEWPH
jgi:hypothetical protein